MSKWEWKKLGEVCDVIAGQSPQSSAYNSEGLGLEFHQGKKAFGKRVIQPSNVWTKEYSKIAKKGDILMSVRAPVGPVNFTDREICIGCGLAAIRKTGALDENFLFYYFINNESNMTSKAGAVFDSINRSDIQKFIIPVPPLSEQKRIVKFLDEEISKIETLKANAETNLKNAKELFETTLEKELNPLSRHSERSEESSADLPSGWEWKKIGDFCETSSGGTPLKQHNEYYENGNIPWLRSGEVCQKEIFETEMYITQKGMENSSAKYFPENSVVVAMYGATAGQVGIVRFRTTTNQAVCGIFPNEKYKTEYLYYALLSKKKELVAQAVGGAQPNISQIKIRNLQIPLPPLSVQKEIVARLDKLSENIKRLETNYKQIIANCDELKKSILKQTFQGGN